MMMTVGRCAPRGLGAWRWISIPWHRV